MSDGVWACHQCQSNIRQANCCNRKTCEFSLFRTRNIEEMTQHMIDVHGEKPTEGWENRAVHLHKNIPEQAIEQPIPQNKSAFNQPKIILNQQKKKKQQQEAMDLKKLRLARKKKKKKQKRKSG